MSESKYVKHGWQSKDKLYAAQLNEMDDQIALNEENIQSLENSKPNMSDIATAVSTHNTAVDSHNDIRLLIQEITTKLNNFLDVDDATSDQLSEVLTLINNNKGTLESLTNGKVNVSDIIDNLTTSASNKPLSAKQGVALKALIDAIKIPTSLPASDVSAWAKASTKPTYTAEEVGAATAESVTQLSEQIANLQIGLTTEQVNALDRLFKVAAYTKDVTEEYKVFTDAFGITDGGSGDNGDSGDSGNGDSGGDDTHTHSYTSSVTTAATCTTAGVKTHTCSCGHSYTQSIPATGHNYIDGVCSVCGAADPNYEPDSEPRLLYNWDFTKSLTDTVSNQTAVLNGTATQDSNGIALVAHTDYVTLGTLYAVGRTYELDIADSGTFTTMNNGNGRLLMHNPPSNWGASQQHSLGVCYRGASATWALYENTWALPETVHALESIKGKTVKYVVTESAVEFYIDETLIASVLTYVTEDRTMTIGAEANTLIGVTVTGLRVYEGVA